MKKVLGFLGCLIILFGLTGCGKQAVIKDKDFSDILMSEGFSVNIVTSQMEDDNVKSVIAANNGKYQIEYYEFKSDEAAKKAYENNRKFFEENGKTKGKERKKKDEYNKYTQELSDTYNTLIRNKNTLLYASVNSEYKKDFNNVLGKLGY